MPDNIFSGIPALDDTAGLEQFVNDSTLNEMGLGNPATPAALQTAQSEPATEPAAAPTAPATPAVPQYTAEQINQIIARNQQLEAQTRAQAMQSQARVPQFQASAYTPYQANIIKQLIDRGVPLERIQHALNGNRQQASVQNEMVRRLQNVESYLQNQQYLTEQNAFIDKMTSFGDKFGLTEDDLVTFGNMAMSKGINLTTVSDVEAVFRAIYPEQYAIRSQRMSGASTSQIYGGANTPEAPRAATSRLEDAYVDNFLRQSMPNQYSQFPNKH